MKKTIVDKAKEYKFPKVGRHNKPVTQDEIDVVLAWVKGELAAYQVVNVLGFAGNAPMLARSAIILREAYKRGFIKIIK